MICELLGRIPHAAAFAIWVCGTKLRCMKNITILHGFWNSALGAACSILLAGVVQGKPDDDKDKDKDGKPQRSEKHNGEKNHENKDGDAHKKVGKDHNEVGKGRNEDRKDHNEAARDHRNDEKADKENHEWRKKNFRADDRTSVIRYFSEYRDKEHGLPPGIANIYLRGRTLPSGWQTRVHSGYVIGDDLKDYFHPLEYSLFPGLEVVADTRLYLYGNRIVRVYEPRREVIDVIEVPTIRFE